MDKEFTGTNEEKLHALLMNVASILPPDIETLYAFMLQRTEDVYGEKLARHFACLTAISRTGLRDADLKTLLPLTTGEPWDDLRFAALRRGFRAHLVQRGVYGQWDFSHAQMRLAICRRSLADGAFVRSLHTAIADHLDALPKDDLLRQTEMMYHLIGTGDRVRAGAYYSSNLSQAEIAYATTCLSEHILLDVEEENTPGLTWVTSLIQQEALNDSQIRILCNRFNFNLLDALKDGAKVGTRISLIEAACARLSDLRHLVPDSAEYAGSLSLSYFNLGMPIRSQGRPQPRA